MVEIVGEACGAWELMSKYMEVKFKLQRTYIIDVSSTFLILYQLTSVLRQNQ